MADADEALISLAGILVAEQTLEKILGQVLDLACRTIPGGDEGGVTLLEREGPATAVATSEIAREVDSYQYDAEDGGPCLEAYRRQQIFRIDSTADDKRWVGFAHSAAGAGIKSTLSLPLIVGGDGIGALNIYCRRERGFSAADEPLAMTFASYASVALANARVYWRAHRLAGQLKEALATRGVIEQAKGILIAEHGCTADEAFDLLTRASQHRHRKLREVAAELVERAQRRAATPDGAQPGRPVDDTKSGDPDPATLTRCPDPAPEPRLARHTTPSLPLPATLRRRTGRPGR